MGIIGSTRCCCCSFGGVLLQQLVGSSRSLHLPLLQNRLHFQPRRITVAANPPSPSTTESPFNSLRLQPQRKGNREDSTYTSMNVVSMEDRRSLESMTVKELRAMMREVGIPPKGVKQDLVSALAAALPPTDDGAISALEQPTSKVASSKSKVDDSPCEHVLGNPSKNSRASKRKTKGKACVVDDNDSNYDPGNLVVEATKRSCISRKGSSTTEKGTIERVSSEPWTVLTHKKPKSGWTAYNPKLMRPPPLSGDVKSLKLMSWNVNGLRALLKSEASCALKLASKENFDVLCLQETKMQEKDVVKIKEHLIDGYDNNFWSCSISKLGYSGTAIISRIKPISVRYGLGNVDHDNEGRLVTIEFDNFYLLNGYVPNSGDGLKRLEYRVNGWDPSLSKYMKDLEKSKPVVLTGDLNCAHEEIDIYDPAGNRRSAGFTNEERKSFVENFLSRGFVDTFRKQHPSVVGYTYYGYRHGGRNANKGWRLDYFLVSESLAENAHDSYILPDVLGSDHCPIGIILKL